MKVRRFETEPRRGAAVVEFAVVLPLLIVMTVGIWEIGRLVDAHQILLNACREAGRIASSGKKTGAEVQQAVLTYIERAGIDTTGMPTPVFSNLTDPSRAEPEDAKQLDRFRITAQLPVPNFQWSPLNFFHDENTVLEVTVDWYSMNDEELTVSTAIPQI